MELRTDKLGLYARGKPLFTALDWQIRTGEFWCVLGRNGAGKSSLLHLLSGLRAAGEGAIRIDGERVDQLSPLALARLRGLMPQAVVDSFSCAVSEAVALGLTPWRLGRGWDSVREIERVQRALAAVGMQDWMDVDITRLSGGERQRVAFAAMLAQDPGLMLFDEPTSHQDVAQQLLLMQLMQRLSANHAVVASCHDINLAARFASHVLLLGEGFHLVGPRTEVLRCNSLSRAFRCDFTETAGLFVAA